MSVRGLLSIDRLLEEPRSVGRRTDDHQSGCDSLSSGRWHVEMFGYLSNCDRDGVRDLRVSYLMYLRVGLKSLENNHGDLRSVSAGATSLPVS